MYPTQTNTPQINELWFDEFIAGIRTHQLQLETNTASEPIKKLYEAIFSKNFDDVAVMNKINANQYFIKKAITEYLREINSKFPLKLAFDLDDSEILIWAEIKDDDEEMENFLLLTEANINANYHKFGYDLTSTIVEERDSLSIPNHYSTLKG